MEDQYYFYKLEKLIRFILDLAFPDKREWQKQRNEIYKLYLQQYFLQVASALDEATKTTIDNLIKDDKPDIYFTIFKIVKNKISAEQEKEVALNVMEGIAKTFIKSINQTITDTKLKQMIFEKFNKILDQTS